MARLGHRPTPPPPPRRLAVLPSLQLATGGLVDIRTYLALGYGVTGGYGLVLFRA